MVEIAGRQTLAQRVIRALWWLAFVFSLFILVGSLPGYWTGVNEVEWGAVFSDVQLAARWIGALLSVGCALLCLGLAALLFF